LNLHLQLSMWLEGQFVLNYFRISD
jgi:hypothetical protein